MRVHPETRPNYRRAASNKQVKPSDVAGGSPPNSREEIPQLLTLGSNPKISFACFAVPLQSLPLRKRLADKRRRRNFNPQIGPAPRTACAATSVQHDLLSLKQGEYASTRAALCQDLLQLPHTNFCRNICHTSCSRSQATKWVVVR